MFPFAHIASAVALNRYALNDNSFEPAVLGALLPDAVDKTLAWVLHVTSSSHHIAHTPLAAVTLSLVARKLVGERFAGSFGAAYIVHLLGDEIHHGRVPWLLPFRDDKRRASDKSMRPKVVGLVFEVCAIAYLASLLQTKNTPPPDSRIQIEALSR